MKGKKVFLEEGVAFPLTTILQLMSHKEETFHLNSTYNGKIKKKNLSNNRIGEITTFLFVFGSIE